MDRTVGPHKRRKLSASQAPPYVLRQLLDDVPIEPESGESDVHITCVEYWNDNLYIGTSAAEILHFVSLPSESGDEAKKPTFILASRLQITGNPKKKQGIQQIVLLPTANKACVLCNGVVTFYSLPELTPAFENTKVNCQWIGGLDLNRNESENPADKPVIMIATSSRIMLVRIGDAAYKVRNIEFPGCLVGARRDTIACVADGNAYSLLEVEQQQKIPLFPISSTSEVFESGHVEDIPQSPSNLKRSSSASYANSKIDRKSEHSRSTSLNTLAGALSVDSDTLRPSPSDRSNTSTPGLSDNDRPQRSISRDRCDIDTTKDLPTTPKNSAEDKQKPLPPAPKLDIARLKPHIVSPTPSEFLLVTGTQESEPGVGMFVNTDGDVVRGTMEFQQYPEAIIIDDPSESDPSSGGPGLSEGYVLAIINLKEEETVHKYLEIQRWDVEPGEYGRQKALVQIPVLDKSGISHVGIKHTTSSSKLGFYELGETLRMVKLKTPPLGGTSTPAEEADPRTNATIEQVRKEKELFESQELTDSESGRKSGSLETLEMERTKEESAFAHRLEYIQSHLVLWSGNKIWRVAKNPLPLQLEGLLQSAQTWENGRFKSVDRDAVIDLLDSIKSTETKTEAEFLGVEYIKQKAGLILFADLLTMDPNSRSESTMRVTEEVLVNSNLDPRLILFMVPFLAEEVLQAKQGIWVHRGLAREAEFYLDHLSETKAMPVVPEETLLNMVKRYLTAWQGKRDYGSVTDETNVFYSVDAALLHLILEQEARARRISQPVTAAARSELNALVDSWKGNFDRAVALLERYRRLFVLSRLYQSRKIFGKVLRTWQRIVNGEKEDDPDVTVSAVEVHVRRYLCKLRDAQLVEEYGSWLASRNSSLGIQVFSDDSAKVKLEPDKVVQLLKKRAPNAVQDYLEHLVFSKNYTQYADDLIAYYLDTVINVLQSSEEARASLRDSYSTYRALRPPKPTYLSFINENTPQESWWQSRLRLLQLLGGPSTVFTSSATTSKLSYSVSAVLARIEPFQDELVSESIILDGRQGRHKEALRLLTHGLGDYDSAIRYCIFGGISSSQPAAISLPPPSGDVAYTEPAVLFKCLLSEFLQIEDVSDRIERTSDLLARFSRWFDVNEVLATVPDDWSVDIISDFLVHVFRDLVSQGRETRIQKALSASLNLRVSVEYSEDVEKRGGWIEDDQGLRSSKSGVEARQIDDDADEDFGEMIDAR
ncbi:TGF beta receptor associated protein 1, putative [Talaromyces stipitatus ATCC 10500]|uniref:TGF beta receptor associated protein 1, putative n=1 Tax=Talaromyces stipitatus (strain ATCC 10500 / CBS 375.48 / QM 6759 / NRRL 1006) TaxID=441959 RepID=B8M1V9_TALSN|nr:TGF beta receptor associated protein 1, putative [Talaromyces stipitatus ATCC 10500]EED21337.1 TGF beta receptor associated protein 1, putative [Talaromyces stipitatus ATCC 10500]